MQESTVKSQDMISQEALTEEEKLTPQLKNLGQEASEVVEEKGIIFAKTDFLGVLTASYVKMIFEKLDDPIQKFQIYIGDKSKLTVFPWDATAVGSGYFFVELPAGTYQISSISIPVGSTLATEETNIFFEVVPAKVVYLGTLRVIGTKEKIRLGGLPLIKPGFEYSIEILDERQEGISIFHENYPNLSTEILVKLMQVDLPKN